MTLRSDSNTKPVKASDMLTFCIETRIPFFCSSQSIFVFQPKRYMNMLCNGFLTMSGYVVICCCVLFSLLVILHSCHLLTLMNLNLHPFFYISTWKILMEHTIQQFVDHAWAYFPMFLFLYMFCVSLQENKHYQGLF